MTAFREKLENIIDGVIEGTVPLATAKEAHLTAHRLVMDKFADVKMFRHGIEDEELRKAKRAMDRVK